MNSIIFLLMETKSQKLLKSLISYYNKDDHLLKLKDITESKHNDNKISLRLIDWLVTNYSKSHNIVYTVNGKHFNLHQNYKDMLKAYSKKMFDPFKRHDRIYIDCPHLEIFNFQTTVAQLTFFKWAVEYKIIDYAHKHKKLIKRDMDKNTKHRQIKDSVVKQKRKELSKLNTKTVNLHVYPICVNFE